MESSLTDIRFLVNGVITALPGHPVRKGNDNRRTVDSATTVRGAHWGRWRRKLDVNQSLSHAIQMRSRGCNNHKLREGRSRETDSFLLAVHRHACCAATLPSSHGPVCWHDLHTDEPCL